MTAQFQRAADGSLTGPTLQQAVFAGSIDPADVVAVREILSSADGTDTALFSDLEFNYTITTTGGDGTLGSPGSVTTVQHNGGRDGTDTLRNVELLVFGNGTGNGNGNGGNGADDGVTEPPEDEPVEGDEGAGDGIGEVIPGDGEVVVIIDPVPDPATDPGTPPVDPAPVDPPANPAPVDPPANPAPVDPPANPAPADPPANPAPVDPAANPAPADPPANPAPVSGGVAVRTVDATGTQVGEIIMAEPGTSRVVVRGLENGEAYRFQVAPTTGGDSEPSFSALSEPVVPGPGAGLRGQAGGSAVAPVPAEPVTEQQPGVTGTLPLGGLAAVAPVLLTALGHYLATGEGATTLGLVLGGLLAAAALLAFRFYSARSKGRAAGNGTASSTNAGDRA
jgi:hypothetical protein